MERPNPLPNHNFKCHKIAKLQISFLDNNFPACYQFVSHFYPFIAAGVDASNKFFRRLSLFPLKCAYSNYLQTGGWAGAMCKQLIIRSLFWFEPQLELCSRSRIRILVIIMIGDDDDEDDDDDDGDDDDDDGDEED